jgi:tetratricopeptide (TPR) repeat protein
MTHDANPASPSGGVTITGGTANVHGDVVGRDKIIQEAPPQGVAALHQLPAPPADFTGRATELSDLREAIRKNGATIAGLQGLGGVGKTALAVKLAEEIKDQYPDAQFYIDLKGVTQPLAPKEAMARVIHAYYPSAQLPEQEDEVRATYLSVLHDKHALLLMDNARDDAQVRPLIPPPGCLLLLTSRQHFTLPGMLSKNLEQMPPEDARKLLQKIAPRLHDAQQDEVDKLAALCGYLPLAVANVGSAILVRADLTPADFIRRLEDTRKRLKLTESDAVLQSSYDLLSEEMRQRFLLLAVFPESFALEAAIAVWATETDSAQDGLGGLLNYSLVVFDDAHKRYRLHDLVRVFASNLLVQQDRMTAEARYSGHYLQVVGQADALYLKGAASITAGLALLDAEWGHIQRGQAWAAGHADADDNAAALCWAYQDAGVNCLELRQHPQEQIRWVEPALAAAKRLKRLDWEGKAMGNLGTAYTALGEYRRAIECHEKDLQISRDFVDHRQAGIALENLGTAYRGLGEHRRAIECYEGDLQIARDIKDRRREGQALGNLGIAHKNLGDYRRAIEYYEQAQTIDREVGNRRAEGGVLGNLGNAYKRMGQYERAVEYHEQALAICRELGDRRGEGQALGNLGVAYGELGQHDRAIAHLEQRLKIAREIGDRSGEANALWNSALDFEQLGDRNKAVERARAALTIYEAINSPFAQNTRDRLAGWTNELRDGVAGGQA